MTDAITPRQAQEIIDAAVRAGERTARIPAVVFGEGAGPILLPPSFSLLGPGTTKTASR